MIFSECKNHHSSIIFFFFLSKSKKKIALERNIMMIGHFFHSSDYNFFSGEKKTNKQAKYTLFLLLEKNPFFKNSEHE